ncbi:hypothetical protein [Brevibacillus dissolubilis]|uniref:hypothetical protein n=1 Tax=Brevibacillus dissolubilis TaxID=1844116 RepID=UPI00159BB6F9|nr:hypothetical protein [Brevibacillus dissolubilis]
MKKFSLILLAISLFQISIVSAASAKSMLYAGETLEKGQVLTSSNGIYSLIWQTDNNLVLYKNYNGSTTSLWSSNTVGYYVETPKGGDGSYYGYDRHYPDYVGFGIMKSIYSSQTWPQALGLIERSTGMVVYRFAPENWTKANYASGSVPSDLTGDVLNVQDDGNVVVYNTKHGNWYPVWATNTAGR